MRCFEENTTPISFLVNPFILTEIWIGTVFIVDAVEGWDDFDWGWKDDDMDAVSGDAKDSEQSSWLQECHMSLSPSGDLIAVANVDRIVFLSRKWTWKFVNLSVTNLYNDEVVLQCMQL